MKIIITTLNDEIFVLDVSEELELENFKAFCEIESGFSSKEITLNFNGRPLTDGKKSLREHGVHDGDVIVLVHILQSAPNANLSDASQALPSGVANLDFSSIQVPSAAGPSMAANRSPPVEEDPRIIREMFLANPDQLALLKQNNPRLADALLTGNVDAFATVLRDQISARTERQQQRIRMMNSDPFDTEAQRMIAEEIRQKNIEANMEAAMEFNPETFGTVVMLYINCHVNGYAVKAFIDSGAQTTIMSAACAERCNIMRLVDTRWAGIAKGVGVQRIIGRIHMVQMRIEQDFLTTSFSVLEEQPMDMLLGLDMLKRHQCNIDLRRNVLLIGTTGTETPFLPESELPDCARLSGFSDDDFAAQLTEQEDRDKAKNKLDEGADGALPSAADSAEKPGDVEDAKNNECPLGAPAISQDTEETEVRLDAGNMKEAGKETGPDPNANSSPQDPQGANAQQPADDTNKLQEELSSPVMAGPNHEDFLEKKYQPEDYTNANNKEEGSITMAQSGLENIEEAKSEPEDDTNKIKKDEIAKIQPAPTSSKSEDKMETKTHPEDGTNKTNVEAGSVTMAESGPEGIQKTKSGPAENTFKNVGSTALSGSNSNETYRNKSQPTGGDENTKKKSRRGSGSRKGKQRKPRDVKESIMDEDGIGGAACLPLIAEYRRKRQSELAKSIKMDIEEVALSTLALLQEPDDCHMTDYDGARARSVSPIPTATSYIAQLDIEETAFGGQPYDVQFPSGPLPSPESSQRSQYNFSNTSKELKIECNDGANQLNYTTTLPGSPKPSTSQSLPDPHMDLSSPRPSTSNYFPGFYTEEEDRASYRRQPKRLHEPGTTRRIDSPIDMQLEEGACAMDPRRRSGFPRSSGFGRGNMTLGEDEGACAMDPRRRSSTSRSSGFGRRSMTLGDDDAPYGDEHERWGEIPRRGSNILLDDDDTADAARVEAARADAARKYGAIPRTSGFSQRPSRERFSRQREEDIERSEAARRRLAEPRNFGNDQDWLEGEYEAARLEAARRIGGVGRQFAYGRLNYRGEEDVANTTRKSRRDGKSKKRKDDRNRSCKSGRNCQCTARRMYGREVAHQLFEQAVAGGEELQLHQGMPPLVTDGEDAAGPSGAVALPNQQNLHKCGEDVMAVRRRNMGYPRLRPMASLRRDLIPFLEHRLPNIVVEPPVRQRGDLVQDILDAVDAARAIAGWNRRNILISVWEQILEPEHSWFEPSRGGLAAPLDNPIRPQTPPRMQGLPRHEKYPDNVPRRKKNLSFPGILPEDKFTEGDVAVLVAMDFERTRVIIALRACEGDRLQALRELRTRRVNSSANKAIWSRTTEPTWPVRRWDPDEDDFIH